MVTRYVVRWDTLEEWKFSETDKTSAEILITLGMFEFGKVTINLLSTTLMSTLFIRVKQIIKVWVR